MNAIEKQFAVSARSVKSTFLSVTLSLATALGAVLTSVTVMAAPETVPLAGEWRLAMGAPKPGVTQQALPTLAFTDTIRLPGTTETNRRGPENPDRWTGGLTRLYRFNGPAWYEREVVIPPAWRGKRVTLILERTKYTQVWLDGRPCGESPILCTAQEYALGQVEPGTHRLTILVDNTRKPVKSEMHQMSDNTQGNWNGIIGRMELRATDAVWIEDVQAHPNLSAGTVEVRLQFGNTTSAAAELDIDCSLRYRGTTNTPALAAGTHRCRIAAGTNQPGTVSLTLPRDIVRWDEFSPQLAVATVRMRSAGGLSDEREVVFGFREFANAGGHFAVNGRATFLRGKHDACVFPLTGHPPMDAEGWLKYFRVCRDYGINHIRFHTWTPPEAAFEAADQLGLYLQPELPYWGSYSDATSRALLPEAERILRAYGNHPSFVMFALGNECSGSREVMAAMIKQLRQRDNRRLYAQGSNNFFQDPTLAEGDDYWTTVRTRTAKGGPVHNVRGSFATVDGGNGHIQIGPPNTRHDYSAGIAGLPVPVIGHEIAQFTVCPNFREIPKYTAVFRARNLEHWRDRLTAAGMLDQADDFFHASARLAMLCYREDIEAALRTPGFGGFQLLDLQDFPGQGTALVGMLDAFMDSKGAITPAEWREFCDAVVLLARFEKYTWTADETFTADLQVAHYGQKDLPAAPLSWRLLDSSGNAVKSGEVSSPELRQGGVRSAGKLTVPLAGVRGPARLTLELRRGELVTHHPLWVYPARAAQPTPAGVTLAHSFNEDTRRILATGGRVLLLPELGRLSRKVGGGFATDFWCWPMFHNTPGTMGLLCDPRHPALAQFPTDTHSHWQWFHLVTNSNPMILDALPRDFRPIVQVIDNLERVHRLGLIFEAQVGDGRLLVCAAELTKLQNRPEARQLLASLLNYAASDRFAPTNRLTLDDLRDLFAHSVSQGCRASASSSQSAIYGPDKAVDGAEGTRWCASTNTVGQWWQVDLGQPQNLTGAELVWEHDRSGYCYVLEGSADGTVWIPLSDQQQNSFKGRHRLEFTAKGTRHVRVRVTGLPSNLWASLREVRLFGTE